MSLIVDIEKRYGDFLLKVQFSTTSELLGLLGTSGCGKSCTLRCIAGIDHPDRGRIVMDDLILFDSDKGIDLPPQKRHVGYLFQQYALFPTMTVADNVLCGLRWKKDKNQKKTVLAEALTLLKLENIAHLRPHQLSGGQSQRVALARLLVNEPRLILLDEPFSALDESLRENLYLELIPMLLQSGKQLLLVSHDRDEILRLCPETVLMEQGRIFAHRDTVSIFQRPSTVAEARLTGCRNLASAIPQDNYTIFVPEWGISLQTAVSVNDSCCKIAVQEDDFTPETAITHPVFCLLKFPDRHGTRFFFRFSTQSPHTPPLYWHSPQPNAPFPQRLGIPPDRILLLHHSPNNQGKESTHDE